jgi:hypothetical protein
MRRSRCASCKILSQDTRLRYAGVGMGYISLCDKCATKLRKGNITISKDEEGKLHVHSMEALK